MERDEERLKAHRKLLGKITVWSGWILALASLLLGSHLLSKMAQRIAVLERENKDLLAQEKVTSPPTKGTERP